jgi:hypothetical protein
MGKRALFLGLAVILAGWTVAGCSSDDDPTDPQPTAKFRVVHASPDVGPLDIYLDSSNTPWLQDVAYGEASTYSSGSPRTVTLVFRAAGANATTDPFFTSDPIELGSGASLTVVAAGLIQSADFGDEFRLLEYSDYYQTTPHANVRTVNAGSDLTAATVFVGKTSQVLASNLARWEESGRAGVEYEAGEVQDVAVTDGEGITSFRVPALDAKSTYYFILTGLISGPGAENSPFTMLIVGPGGNVERGSVESRDFRAVHAVPDGGTVDVRVVTGLGVNWTRSLLMEGAVYGDATGYGQLEDIRQVIIEIYQTGADPTVTEPFFAGAAYIHEEGLSTTIFTAGLVFTFNPEVMVRLFSLADDFPVPDVGETVARLVHTVPNLDALRVDFGNDGSDQATMERFSGNSEGAIFLTADTGLQMVVREGPWVVGLFTTPELAADKQHYLVLTGIMLSVPDISLLTLTQDGSLGFTNQDIMEGK